jgi:two-component system sensor histidine kinase CpxA
MRSLFLKIFLWYWVTVMVVGLALTATFALQPELLEARWRASTGNAIALYAQVVAEQYDRGDAAEAEATLQKLHGRPGIDAALLSADGTILAGTLPKHASEVIRMAAASDKAEYVIHTDSATAAQPVKGSSGALYIFVAEMTRGPWTMFRANLQNQTVRWTVALIVSSIICYLLALYLTAPILRLRTAARTLAKGDLHARADARMERRRDEIGELVRDFNMMADRIESLVASQRQLTSDISHELRSPLARLNVALELARQRSGPDAAGVLNRIEKEAERLNELIGRLLTLARLESATTPPEKAPVDMAGIVREVADDAAFEAQQRNCQVKLSLDGNCAVTGSSELLRSAVENVVRNALRYTESGTAVEISLRHENGDAVLTVRDHGPGVPPHDLARIFRPFYRLTAARERNTGGVGLGLAITQRAVVVHGGSVHAENAPGGGLVVEMRLPC